MDTTRKLSAVLGDDELFKQKALAYFTAADQNESGTLGDEDVLEVRTSLAKHRPNLCVPDPHARQRRADPDTLLISARVSFAVRSVSGAAGLTKARAHPGATQAAHEPQELPCGPSQSAFKIRFLAVNQ